MGTRSTSTSDRGRRVALGAAAVVTVGLATAYASTTGAQPSTDPIAVELVSVDSDGAIQQLPDTATPAISDTGAVVAYDAMALVAEPAANAPLPPTRRVWIRDRVGGTSRPVAETNSAAPGISGNGCIVAYSSIRDAAVELTVVDRCATPISAPLPIGSVIDTVVVDAAPGDPGRLSTPALSFDGSTIVWSTGDEIRRFVRPANGETHQRTQSFDVVDGGTPEIVTGADVDVSSDGATTVFVAGPGTAPYEPDPANVYVWSASTPDLDPELVSVASSDEPGTAPSTSPTISGDGTFVVFQSLEAALEVVGATSVDPPFVVGVDLAARTAQILVDDASQPAVSTDGNHVAYQRGDGVRVLSSDATSTVDVPIAELATARPTSRLSVSQFGRWIVFASRSELSGGNLDPAPSGDTPSVWAVDRRSSALDVVDTTTTSPTTTTATTVPATPTTTTSGSEVGSLPTVPASTVVPTVTVPRFPTSGSQFPRVVLPSTPRRTDPSATTSRLFDPGVGFDTTPFASPVVFESTVVDAGRRTASVALTNPTTSAIRVSSISVEVAGVFTLVDDGCSGVAIAPNATCVVDVQFSPVTEGRSIGSTTFLLLDDSVVTASLEGEGVAAPTLDLIPTVAGAGQTVTIFGNGFTAGSTVEVTQPGVAAPEPVIVDADGTFAHVIVVLPNTPTGPASLTVIGQPDVFDDVVAELLVSSRGSTSADAALRSGRVGAFGR